MKKWFTSTVLATSLLITTNLSAEAATFSDVTPNHWAYKEITTLADQKILGGYSDGTFKGANPVTRAQSAKFLALSLNMKPSANYAPSFTDVSPTNGAYQYISPLTEHGIFKDGKLFNPNNRLTRAQMAKTIAVGYGLIVDDHHQLSFSDVSWRSEFHGYITTLAEVGITTTSDKGAFNPNGQVTREQLAAFIYRANEFKAALDKGTIYYDNTRKIYIDKTKPLPPVANQQPEIVKTIDLVNKQRTLNNKLPLNQDAELSRIAQAKADDMAKLNYFAHESPTYGSVDKMLATFNYSWTSLGENLAQGYTTAESAVTGWMNSPGHRENILTNKYTNIGIGYAVDTRGKTYWVHIFTSK